MRKVALLAGGLVLLLCVAASAGGAVYYVAQQEPKASDDSPGTEAAPWKTITRALTELKAGDTLYVRKGIYREELILPRKDWNWKGVESGLHFAQRMFGIRGRQRHRTAGELD